MNSLSLLKNISNHNINNVFKSAVAKTQTAPVLTNPSIKLHATGIFNDINQHRNSTSQHLNIYITVETQWFTHFRQLIMSNFKDYISSIRIEPIDHARKMKVCLCFDGKIEDKLITAIMRCLPSAEFGRISLVHK